MLNKLFAFILSVISFFLPLAEIESPDVLSLSEETVVAQSAPQYGVVGIESVEAEAGDTVKVAVYLYENPGFIALRLFIGYDDTVMTLVGAEDFIEGDISTFGNDYTENPYTLLWVDSLSETDYMVTGKIAELTFRVFDDAFEGSYDVGVTIDEGSTLNCELEEVPFMVETGTVTVKEPTPIKIVSAENSTTVIDEKNSYIYGLSASLDEETFRSDYVTIQGKGSLILNYDSEIGTGTTVTVIDSRTNESVAEYTIIIFGDSNGDGITTTSDLIFLKSIISGSVDFDETSAQFFALDINGDGTLGSTDEIELKSALSGAKEISQSRG